MQLIVAHTFCPGVVDSSDWVAEDLETALKENGHEVETMSLPFDPMSSPLEQVLAFRLFGPVEHGDILVALHAPCHVTSHRRKVIWGVDDAFRSEDLMPPGYFTNGGASETIRESLRRSDRAAYGEAHRVFLRSRIACEEFFRETGVHADFLPLPPRRLAPGADSESMLAARTGGVRISLLLTVLEALATSTSSLRLKLFGTLPFSTAQWHSLLAAHQLLNRVELRDAGDWPDALPTALAVLDLSGDADSLGQITIDAHGCEKPVIAFQSAAAAEWIDDRHNGWIVEPGAESLRATLDDLDSERTRHCGLQGRARLKQWGANWPHAVEALTAP